MNPIEFDEEMSRLLREFPGMKFTATRSQMVWKECEFLPRESFAKVVNHMIASFRRNPTVQDFIDALASDARVYSPRSTPQPFKADCWRCDDLGLLMASGDGVDVLCKCQCARGLEQRWRLPDKADLAKGFEFQKLLHELFVPNFTAEVPRTNDDLNRAERRVGVAITQKGEWWRETVRISEETWKQYLQQQD